MNRRMTQKQVWLDKEDVVRLRSEQRLDADGERESDAQTFKRIMDERSPMSGEQTLVLLRVDKKRI